jgi:hypothetical protein
MLITTWRAGFTIFLKGMQKKRQRLLKSSGYKSNKNAGGSWKSFCKDETIWRELLRLRLLRRRQRRLPWA